MYTFQVINRNTNQVLIIKGYNMRMALEAVGIKGREIDNWYLNKVWFRQF